MLLNDLVEVSTAVASTRSRTGKRDLIAALLMRLSPDEVEIATAYLAGLLRQRRTGVGWRSLTDLPPPASTPTVGLTEVDATLESLEKIAGAGSANKRRDLVDGLFTRMTAAEQDYLRALITGSIRQGAQDAIVLEAIAAATGLSIAVVRRAAMFSAPTGPVALAALTGGEEALADFTLVAGRPARPMLASSAPDVAAALEKLPAPVAVDTKLDGIRIQVHKRGDEVTVFSRSLDDIGDRLPAVTSLVRSLPARDLILDGEALMLDDAGRPRLFQETASSSANHAGDSGLRPWFFDILLRDDVVLLDEPLGDRLAVLDDVVPAEHRVGRLEGPDPQVASDYFDSVVAAGHEGVVVKDLGAPYAAGRRGSAWVKVKPRHTLDLVVLAVEWGSGRRRGLLSNIHLGARDPETDGWVIGKDLQGDDRRDARLADRAILGIGDAPRETRRASAPRAGRRDRLRRRAAVHALSRRRRPPLRSRSALPRRQDRSGGRHHRRRALPPGRCNDQLRTPSHRCTPCANPSCTTLGP